jgi:hypothetical protein
MPEFHLPSNKTKKSRPKDLGLLQKGFIGYTDGFRTWKRIGAEV